MLLAGNKCWARSMKKWLLKNQPQKVAGSLLLAQPSLKMAPQLVTTHVLQAKTIQLPLKTALGTMHIHLTHLIGMRGQVDNQVFWCNMHNVQVEVRMAKMAML